MNLEKMTDKELSSKLMDLMHPDTEHWCLSNCETFVYDCGPTGEQYYKLKIIDINDWSDIMSVSIELGVSLTGRVDSHGYYQAGKLNMSVFAGEEDDELVFYNRLDFDYYDKSPKRALAICCIKVLSK